LIHNDGTLWKDSLLPFVGQPRGIESGQK